MKEEQSTVYTVYRTISLLYVMSVAMEANLGQQCSTEQGKPRRSDHAFPQRCPQALRSLALT